MEHSTQARTATRRQSRRPAPWFAALGLAALALATALSAHASPPMDGIYIGGFGKPGDYVLVWLELKPGDGGRLAAALEQPFHVAGSIPVSAVEAEGARIRFTAKGTAYDLTRTDIGYAGVVTSLERMGTENICV